MQLALDQTPRKKPLVSACLRMRDRSVTQEIKSHTNSSRTQDSHNKVSGISELRPSKEVF